jgi:adenine-specific DNA-methyltransferase
MNHYETLSAVEGLLTIKDANLIYFDPPYNTGRDFDDFNDKFESTTDYRENLIRPVIQACFDASHPSGVLVVHVESKISHHIRIVCDDIYGESNFVNEIIWKSGGNHHSSRKLQRNHDVIIVYAKSKVFTFNPIYEDYSEDYLSKCKEDARGKYTTSALKNSQPNVIKRPNLRYTWNGHDEQWWCSQSKMQILHDDDRLVYGPSGIPRVKKYIHELKGVPIKDLWTDIPQIQGNEKLNYATQKPVKLLERIITLFSNPNDLVVDPFAGSGVTGRACKNLQRNFMLFDINPKAKEIYEN